MSTDDKPNQGIFFDFDNADDDLYVLNSLDMLIHTTLQAVNFLLKYLNVYMMSSGFVAECSAVP